MNKPDLPTPFAFRKDNLNYLRPTPEQINHWQTAFRQWYAALASAHTRRAYLGAWSSLLDFSGKPAPALTRADLAAWMDHLKARGLAPATIRQRMAAISSFFHYVSRVYLVRSASGQQVPLHPFNPAASLPRPHSSAKRDYHALTIPQARALLQAMDRTTLAGQRDYALFLAYLLTGRRSSEIRQLKAGDFTFDGRRAWYTWPERGHPRRAACPPALWEAVTSYLTAAGSAPPYDPAQYLFTPLCDNAARLPRVDAASWHRNRPLSTREVSRLLKKYARRAGLDPTGLTLHTLRHTAAVLRRQAGDESPGPTLTQLLDTSRSPKEAPHV